MESERYELEGHRENFGELIEFVETSDLLIDSLGEGVVQSLHESLTAIRRVIDKV